MAKYEEDKLVDRRGFLQCMAWVGTGAVWPRSGGVLKGTPLFAHSASRHQRHQYDPPMVRAMARTAGLEVRSVTLFALPLQRYTEGVLPGRRPRLATLFLADLQRPE